MSDNFTLKRVIILQIIVKDVENVMYVHQNVNVIFNLEIIVTDIVQNVEWQFSITDV